MNQHLETILKLIRQSDRLSADEKESGVQAVQQTEAELETKNRDLEIEASLERVRAVALIMKKPDELLSICKILFGELLSLGFSELRNAMINIHNDVAGSFLNYSFSETAGATVTTIFYNSNPETENLVRQIRKADDAFAEFAIRGSELDKWKEFRKGIGEPDDPGLDNIPALYYYFYSIGIGAIGISTYSSVTEEKRNVLKRFRNVFDFAYRRYMDVTQAEAQAREAKIEASLERVRSKAMAMQKSEDLASVVATIFEELDKLNLGMMRCGIGILNKETYKVDVWTTTVSDHGKTVQVSGDESMDIHPLLQGAYEAWLRQEDFSYVLKGKDLLEYYRALAATNFRLPDSQQIISEEDGLQQYYFNAMFQAGGLFAFRETEFPEEAITVMKRFAGVFNLTYKRFLDLQKAEAQTRESQIQLALERVRARTMAMQKSDELAETSFVLFRQLKELGEVGEQITIGIFNEAEGVIELYATIHGKQWRYGTRAEIDEPIVIKKIYTAWKEQKKSLVIDLTGEELHDYNKYRWERSGGQVKSPIEFSQDRWVINAAFFSRGILSFSSHDPHPQEIIRLLEHFAEVFDLTYTRFLDLKQAEAQTHKAQIEVALERVRSRALAMHEPEELVEVAHVLRLEMGLLGMEEIETGTVFIFDETSDTAQLGFTAKDTLHPEKRVVSDNVTLDLKRTLVGRELLQFFKSAENQISVRMEGTPRREWIEYIYSLSPAVNNFFGENIQDKTYHLYKFSNGAVGAASPGDVSKDTWDLLKRAASVFSLAYSRFKDLSKARVDLQNLKDEKKRSDSLLLNILPEEIANELKQFGKSYARKHEQVSIMFADIKGFSSIAENLSADELVTQLDECFRAFDHIVDKHGLEKIKTIGDAYVCACGLPKPVPDNAVKTVKAALDMLDFIKSFGLMKKIQDLPVFEFRVGIHTGPVITGVVGLKKFTYDIWGDAVNMAARMEQHGEAGKINISGNTYQLIKDKFTCTHRGKIKAKNKGEVDMYFVEHLL